MADEVRLAVPRLEVTMDDGTVFRVQAINPDLLRYDRTAAKHGWPAPTAAPFLWLTFLAWSAARRTNAIPDDLSWDDFANERCQQVRNLTDETPDEAAANGTVAGDVAVPFLTEAAPE